MLNYSSFCVSAAITGLFVSRPEVVIATSPQLLVGLAGWWLARAKRAPFVFEVRDLWPESLAAVGMGDPNSFLHRVLGRIAGFLYRHCDHVVVVTAAFKDHLIKYWRIPPEKISVVENGVETGLFSPGDSDQELRRELGAEGKICGLLYRHDGHGSRIGNHGRSRGPPARIRSPGSFPVGGGRRGEGTSHLSGALARLDQPVFYRSAATRKDTGIHPSLGCLSGPAQKDGTLQDRHSHQDAGIHGMRPSGDSGSGGPGAKILDEAQAGLFIEPENSAALVQAILRLDADAALRDSFGRNGLRHILRHFSRPQTAEDYLTVLQAVVNQE